MIVNLRQCSECKKDDFTECLTKVSVRRYKHGDNWQTRCKFFKDNPNATLEEARNIGRDKK